MFFKFFPSLETPKESCSYNKKYNSHTDPIFKSLNYLKVDDIYELNVLKFYFNYCHLMVPSDFIKFNFSQRLDIHNYETRFKTKLNIVKTKSKVADKCLRCDTPKLSRSLPQIFLIKYIHTVLRVIYLI